MTNRERQAALRIQLLVEEFSPAEIAGAITLLGATEGEDLFHYLARSYRSPVQPSHSRRTTGPLPENPNEIRALRDIKTSDPEKYAILTDLSRMIREDKVLKTLDDFRSLIRFLGKDFTPGKSRKEASSRLIAALVQLNVPVIQKILARINTEKMGDDLAFFHLANNIIAGGSKSSDE